MLFRSDRISGGRAEWATIAAGVLLASAVLLARQNLGSPAAFFESVIRNDLSIAALFSLAASLFLVLAALNEIIWRTQTTDFWVAFKVFGVVPLTFVFAALQYPLLMKYDATPKKDEAN